MGTLRELSDETAAAFAAVGTEMSGRAKRDMTDSTSALALTGAVSRPVLEKLADGVSVKDFGAKGDITTNDTAAFAAALAASAYVFVPDGIYNVRGLDLPANKVLYGPGTLRTLAANDFVVRMGASSRIDGLTINGNNLATKGVVLNGDFCEVYRCQIQYSVYGIYNVANDLHSIVGTRTTENTYGIYSADRFISCTIDRHYSGQEDYFLYLTYSAQQPQFVNVTNSNVVDNDYGIWCAKDIYVLNVLNTNFDIIAVDAIVLDTPAPGMGSDIYIGDGCFISSEGRGIVVAPGYFHVSIQRLGIGNQQSGSIIFQATSSVRTTRVSIRDVNFGQSGNYPLLADSVEALSIEDCSFAATQAAPYNTTRDIVITGTYSGGATSKALVSGNRFQKATPYNVGANIDSTRNIGWVTKNVGIAPMTAGQVSFDVTHGLSATPTQMFVTPKGSLGSVWVSNVGATTFRVNCSVAPGADTPFSWDARCDP